MENIGVGMPFSDLTMERYPLGFMDLLGGISHYALIHPPAMQLPATPSSISSASCEAVTGEEKNKDYEGEEQQHKRNKRFKSTKMSSSEQTKMRVPKVSFITKSQVNNLDDGYKWRKYGQKPVRSSPFPRNYYRCTTSWCDVKKRVERSFDDPSNVITTYEGQHTHPRPLIMSKRGSFGSNGSACSGSHFGLPELPPQLHQLFDYNINHHHQQQELSFFGTEYLNRQEKRFDHDDEDDDDHDHVMKKSLTQDLLNGAGLVKDHGLLQDVVPAHIIKEEY